MVALFPFSWKEGLAGLGSLEAFSWSTSEFGVRFCSEFTRILEGSPEISVGLEVGFCVSGSLLHTKHKDNRVLTIYSSIFPLPKVMAVRGLSFVIFVQSVQTSGGTSPPKIWHKGHIFLL